MRITIIGRAPSVNGLYRVGQGGNIYLSQAGRVYKESVKEKLDGLKVTLPEALRRVPLFVTYEFFFPELWGPHGEPLEIDVDNRIKIVQDAVSRALRFSDAWIFTLLSKKRVGPERAIVTLEPDPETAV